MNLIRIRVETKMEFHFTFCLFFQLRVLVFCVPREQESSLVIFQFGFHFLKFPPPKKNLLKVNFLKLKSTFTFLSNFFIRKCCLNVSYGRLDWDWLKLFKVSFEWRVKVEVRCVDSTSSFKSAILREKIPSLSSI